MLKKSLKEQKAITLIALIITIIVLLILAIVSINLIMNNGIINKSKYAVDKYSEEEVKEKIALAYQEYQMSQYTDNPLTMEQALANAGLTGATVQQTSDGWNIRYGGKEYPLSSSGSIGEVINWNEIIANAQKHPDQSSTNDEIGIDMYGNPVNLDLWFYEFDEANKTFITGKENGSKPQVGYIGNIVDGKIVGEVPQYIKKNNETYILTNMSIAFYNNTSLTVAPAIPNSVSNMEFTFHGCIALTTAPEIPYSVTNMGGTFSGCTSLTVAPNIPNSVTILGGDIRF